ncbi:MAG: hypothetical protein AABW84_01460 [Nanoarchaeota archaeon]
MAINTGNDWTTTYWLMGVNPNYIGDASEDTNTVYRQSKKARKTPKLEDNQNTLDIVLD